MRYARIQQGHTPLPGNIIRVKKTGASQKGRGIDKQTGHLREVEVRVGRLSTFEVYNDMSPSEYQSIYADLRRRHGKALDKLSKT